MLGAERACDVLDADVPQLGIVFRHAARVELVRRPHNTRPRGQASWTTPEKPIGGGPAAASWSGVGARSPSCPAWQECGGNRQALHRPGSRGWRGGGIRIWRAAEDGSDGTRVGESRVAEGAASSSPARSEHLGAAASARSAPGAAPPPSLESARCAVAPTPPALICRASRGRDPEGDGCPRPVPVGRRSAVPRRRGCAGLSAVLLTPAHQDPSARRAPFRPGPTS
jgi:hypothetical protein